MDGFHLMLQDVKLFFSGFSLFFGVFELLDEIGAYLSGFGDWEHLALYGNFFDFWLCFLLSIICFQLIYLPAHLGYLFFHLTTIIKFDSILCLFHLDLADFYLQQLLLDFLNFVFVVFNVFLQCLIRFGNRSKFLLLFLKVLFLFNHGFLEIVRWHLEFDLVYRCWRGDSEITAFIEILLWFCLFVEMIADGGDSRAWDQSFVTWGFLS